MNKTIKSLPFGAFLISGILAVSGCGPHTKPPLDYIPHMFDSPAVKAQHLGPNGEGMRTPPAGTLAINQEVYHYATDPDGAGRDLKNPIKRTKENLLRGQKLYNTYCIVCHGKRAEGDGYIVPKFPRPPSLHSEKVTKWTDGRIFHVITMGQNLMPSYASQVSVDERWAIINYIRVLQRSLSPTADDLKAFEKYNQ